MSTLVKAFHELYAVPLQRVSINKGIHYKKEEAVFWRIVYSSNTVKILLTLPHAWKEFIVQKINSVWPHAPLQEVETELDFNPDQCAAAKVFCKHHWLFSLSTHSQTSAPYPSLLEPVRDMKDTDKAEIQILIKPTNDAWQEDWIKAFVQYQEDKIRRQIGTHKESLAYRMAEKFEQGCSLLEQGLGWILRADKKKDESQSEVIQLIRALQDAKDDELSPSSKKKGHYKAFEVSISIMSQSENEDRRKLTARSLATTFQELNENQELVYEWASPPSLYKNMKNWKVQGNSRNILSVPELCKLVQLPTAGIQTEYGELMSLNRREVSISNDELFQEEGIPIGYVTEKNISRLARRPIKPYDNIELKHVYDALCTPEFNGGKMGTGKTGAGVVQAIEFIKAGFTAFVMDTADGQGIQELEDSLPEDYPEHKLIHIDLDNKMWPVALNWGDILGRQLEKGDDQELEILEVSERITNRLVEFIGNMATSEFTDRMKQYLVACSRAVISSKPDWSFLDIELALKSPSYREELLKHPDVKSQPEIYDDLVSLQFKAENDSIRVITDPIISRFKMLSSSRFLANMFMQPAKLDNSGRPLMDFRRFMDNPEGGYGYLICIHASSDAWGEDGQELTLGFLTDKINLAGFSRVDIPQGERKPTLFWLDEPHKVIKKTARYFKNGAVEFRKYRVKLLFSGHSLAQMGAAADALKDGGCQFTWYKTENVKAFDELSEQFAPYNPEELYATLPEKWQAVNKVRLPSGQDCPAFIAQMMAPPALTRSRENRRKECTRAYGRHWKEVSDYIQTKRLAYQKKDESWYMERLEKSTPKGGKRKSK